jgi:hypothetical protein
MRCYWGGWEVRTASGWTGRFLKGAIKPDAHGAFVLPNLQLGSESETTSEWHPVLLGGNADAACTQLVGNRKPTGEYTGPWPAPGVKVLYRGGPVHRTE